MHVGLFGRHGPVSVDLHRHIRKGLALVQQRGISRIRPQRFLDTSAQVAGKRKTKANRFKQAVKT